jgi:hypothetical protein
MRGFIGNVIVLVSVITVASPYLHPALANSQPLTGNQLKLLLNGSMIEADGECRTREFDYLRENSKHQIQIKTDGTISIDANCISTNSGLGHRDSTTGIWKVENDKVCLVEDQGKDYFQFLLSHTEDRCFAIYKARFTFELKDSRNLRVWRIWVKNSKLPEGLDAQFAKLQDAPPPSEVLTRKTEEDVLAAKQQTEQASLLAEKKQREAEERGKAEERQRLAAERERLEQERQRVAEERERLEETRRQQAKTREENKEIQQSLKTLGYYKGTIDGVLGRGSRASVMKWQRSKGHKATGKLDPIRFVELKSDAVARIKDIEHQNSAEAKSERLRKEEERKREIAEQARQKQVAEQERKKQTADAKADRQRKIAEFKSDPKTGFLFAGSDRDIVFLFNETGRAKHGIRDLDGKLTFEDGLVSFCGLYGLRLDKKIAGYISLALNKSGIDGSLFPRSPKRCGNLSKFTQDILVYQRGRFVSQDFDKINALVDYTKNKKLAMFSVFDFKAHKTMLASRSEQSASILKSVEAGGRNGFGLLLPQIRSSSVCVVKTDDQPTVRLLLSALRKNDPITLKNLSPKKVVAASLNDNFVKLKKQKCGYLFANAGSLKKLIGGLKRDQIKFKMHHEWISKKDIAQSKSADQKPKAKASTQKKKAEVGKSVGMGGVWVKVVSIKIRQDVGDGFTNFESGAKESIYTVIWEIRNQAGKELDFSGSPLDIFLADPNGKKHSLSVPASEAFAGEVGKQSKLPIKLGGLAKQTIATAFVVHRGMIKKSGWKVHIAIPNGDVILQ